MTRILRAKAPTRIDLAGGTLDLWPLYLLTPTSTGPGDVSAAPPATINLGIDLFAEADLEITPAATIAESHIRFESEDQKGSVELAWNELGAYAPPPSLELHTKLFRAFANGYSGKLLPPARYTLRTRAKSPAGAGLGGSSTLAIAIASALHAACYGLTSDAEISTDTRVRLIELVRDVETTVIRVPAGTQDYFGAMFGELQKLEWRPGRFERSVFSQATLNALNDRLMLIYSGQSRNSGINNWEMFKGLVDRKPGIAESFGELARATRALETALLAQNWAEASAAISTEWEARRKLAPGISTAEIDHFWKDARVLGASAMKICGAGGGGCFFLWFDEPSATKLQDQRRAVTECIARHAQANQIPMRALAFRGVPHGIRLTQDGVTNARA